MFSIIVLTKNVANITALLNSLFIQKYDKGYEILIYDTGLKFDDRLHIKKLLNDMEFEPHSVESNSYSFKKQNVDIVFYNYKDKKAIFNYSRENNFLATKAKYDILFFLNDDVYFNQSDLLEYLDTFINNLKEFGTIGSRLMFPNGTIQHDGVKIDFHNNNYYFGHINYMQLPSKAPQKYVLQFSDVKANTGAFLVIKKDVFFSVNGFNEDYISCFQDVELNLNISKKGLKNYIINFIDVVHNESNTRKKLDREVEHRQIQHDYKIINKYCIENEV